MRPTAIADPARELTGTRYAVEEVTIEDHQILCAHHPGAITSSLLALDLVMRSSLLKTTNSTDLFGPRYKLHFSHLKAVTVCLFLKDEPNYCLLVHGVFICHNRLDLAARMRSKDSSY